MKRTASWFAAALVTLLLGASSGVFAKPGDVVKTLKSPGPCLTGLAWDGHLLWAADRRTDKLYAVDPTSGKVVKTLPAPGYWPLGLAFDGKTLWCVDKEDNKIYQISPATGEILHAVDSPARNGFGLAWDGKYLWLADDGSNQILQISTDDGTTVRSFPAPSGHPQGLAFDGTYLWIADRIADELYIATTDGEVLFVLKSPGPYATGLAFDGQHLWNADYQTDKLYKLKVDDREVFSRSNPRHATVTLTHQVRNQGPGKITRLDVYFALPENRDSQEIEGKFRFSPQPADFATDQWGQRFAHFSYTDIPPQGVVTSKMEVKTTVYEITYYVRPEKVGSLTDIPQDIRTRFTQDGSKYMLKNPIIQKAAREAVGNEKNPYWIARKIYRYLMGKMHYELAGGWNVAPAVLARGSGSCSEYSFVYIAMARAAGLPARYVGSVVVRGDDASLDDVFHRWVEVYLPGYGWVPVDPSGGDQPSRRAQALYFGHLSNRFLITTQGGGDSRYMGWTYNMAETWHAEPKTKLQIEAIAEWEPVGK
ncbi:MAG TPA: transglutaminase [Bacteroidetes bacterium]|nr:transglutaminase [Bacteroidota bacterium]